MLAIYSQIENNLSKEKNAVDFNLILKFFNILISFFTIVCFYLYGENIYIDSTTVLLSIFLSIQTHFVLTLEHKNRDIFIMLYSYVMIFYFSLRILTLIVFSFSHVFDRFPYHASDSNFALFYIIISNTFLYAGLMSVKFNKESNAIYVPRKRFSMFILLYFIMILFGKYSTIGSIQILSLIGNFFEPRVVVIVGLIFLMLYSNKINRVLFYFIVCFVFLQIINATLGGSRSGLVTIIETSLIIILVVKNFVSISKNRVYLGILLTPLFVALLIFFYIFATITRMNMTSGDTIDKSIIYEQVIDNINGDKFDYMLANIAGRIGFFDFSSEVIAHEAEYEELFQLSTYSKSIIDNIFTPGFDVFDQPKISNSMTFIYNSIGEPKKSLVDEIYQSDQIGIHGEMYSLFGYGSIFLFYLVGFCFKLVYKKMKNENIFVQSVNRVFIVMVFFTFVRSFGIDWLLYDILVLFLALHISVFFFRIKLTQVKI